MSWSVHKHILLHQLTVVFVGSEHIGLNTLLASLGGQCADDVVSLKSLHFEHRNVVSLQDALDNRY